MAHHLILVKHSAVRMDPETPRALWTLSDEGRAFCAPLATALAAYAPTCIYTSPELKAYETAELLARPLGIARIEVSMALHENDRSGQAFVTAAHFRHQIATFFKRHDERIIGMESADEAARRFTAAIAQIVTDNPRRTIVVVAHGVVISLFVAAYNAGVDPMTYWQQLEMPSFAVLQLPAYTLLDTVHPA